MKKKLNLFVFTGWPADGKTTLSKRLSLDGFTKLSTDELRRELYPQNYNIPPYPNGWFPIWDEICQRRNKSLIALKTVVIDSCAHTQSIRDRFFDLNDIEKDLIKKEIFVARYLVQLIVTEEERTRRFRKDNTIEGGSFSIRRMSSEFQNIQDYRREGVDLLQLSNNNEEEQDICYNLLRKIAYCGSE